MAPYRDSRVPLLPRAASPAPVAELQSPASPAGRFTRAKVGLITGGDISADGSEILLRTYQNAYLYHRAPGATVADALATSPCEVPAADERQGEAIAFVPGSKDYYTLSEGINQPLYLYKRN